MNGAEPRVRIEGSSPCYLFSHVILELLINGLVRGKKAREKGRKGEGGKETPEGVFG